MTKGCLLVRRFREDLAYWIKQDRKIASRILELVENTLETPFKGLGKPEPLRHGKSNIGSRRITQEHRLVYRVADDRIEFLQARYHY